MNEMISISKQRKRKGGKQFLVSWSTGIQTWELWKSVAYTPVLRAYYEQRKLSKRKKKKLETRDLWTLLDGGSYSDVFRLKLSKQQWEIARIISTPIEEIVANLQNGALNYRHIAQLIHPDKFSLDISKSYATKAMSRLNMARDMIKTSTLRSNHSMDDPFNVDCVIM